MNKLNSELSELVTDAELDIVFANANYGGLSKRDVVKFALLKAAGYWHQGHTSNMILKELGLITKERHPRLTKRGGRYLYRAYKQSDF